MSVSHFLRIEREAKDGSRHYVVHTLDPKFSMEIMPDGNAPDKVGKGVIKRIRVPNSWAGDYGKYAKLMSAAQEFLRSLFLSPWRKQRLDGSAYSCAAPSGSSGDRQFSRSAW
jgi:hypothetical protein